MAFHVFVEGATDDTPAGVARLADAIAKHYGLPAADLLARLQRGRFRVKGNIDRTLAEQYRRDLERLGARCTIEEATAENSQRATPLPFPAVRPATPPAGVPVGASAPSRSSTPPSGPAAAAPSRSSTPPSGLAAAAAPSRPSAPSGLAAAAAPSRPSAPALGATAVASTPLSGLAAAAPSRPSTPPSGLAAAASTSPSGTPQYQSGLAAAFASEAPAVSLGALEQGDLPLSLASVDGADEAAPSPTAFEPPASAIPASIGPPPAKAKPAKAERPKDVPLDLFAPPDAQGAELSVDIAADELDITAKKRAATPPPVADEPARPSRAQSEPASRASQPSLPGARAQSEPASRTSQPSLHAPHAAAATAAPATRGKLGPLGDTRVRFAAGVLLAILIGFVPAHFVGAMREESAYKAIDDKVIAAQQLADTPELYATLDKMRADQLDKKRGEQRNTAIIALAIWALVAGGVAFAWFKKVPWERFE